MSPVIRKHAFAHGKTKAQISAFVFRDVDSIIPLLSKPLAIFCGCRAQFKSDLVRNPEDRFSHTIAHVYETCQDRNLSSVL